MRASTEHRRLTSVRAAFLALAVASGDSGPVQPHLTFAPDTLPVAHLGRRCSVTISVSSSETPVFSLQVGRGTLPPDSPEEAAPSDIGSRDCFFLTGGEP
jgi:hypothetical protein